MFYKKRIEALEESVRIMQPAVIRLLQKDLLQSLEKFNKKTKTKKTK